MPLDPQLKALLDAAASADQTPLHELSSAAEARARAEIFMPALEMPKTEVGRIEDRTIPGGGGDIPVRIYHPRDAASRARGLPLLVYYHGGGWVIGSIATHDGACRHLAAAGGAIVVSVDYRLAPEHKFPAAVEDAWAALSWVADQAEALGADPARLAVAGDSAGGNLAAVMTQRARDEGGPALAYQLLIYPAVGGGAETDSARAFAAGYPLEKPLMDWFYDCYLRSQEDARDLRVAPLLSADLGGLPPASIVTAEFDPLRDEGAAYAGRLAEAGVQVEYVCAEGLTHAFLGMTGAVDQARAALEAMAASLRRHFA